MNKWIIALIAVVVIIGGLGYAFRHSIKALFVGSKPALTQTTPPPPPVTMENYASSTLGISLAYPAGYTLDESYVYDQFGPKKLIHGVSLTIPATMATGTNLSTDTHLSVEQLPHAKKCTADIFLLANVKALSLPMGSTTYSIASSTGAGAGNRYEEMVYAIADSKPCTAVRYTIHYGVIDNYPPGTVQEFDRAKLLSDFDSIRDSLKVGL